jgi:hypothetical protein
MDHQAHNDEFITHAGLATWVKAVSRLTKLPAILRFSMDDLEDSLSRPVFSILPTDDGGQWTAESEKGLPMRQCNLTGLTLTQDSTIKSTLIEKSFNFL